ncbi:DUF2776 family protein [Actinocorallia aurantiaca]|uniref:DUF2776 domain-containing protein n=1 Tax=Actinocorallia aurantiaca TaxID=46204 RepID=A0ABP6H666_9ACTN
MNLGISVLFRAIPLVMGAVCLAFGLYLLRVDDAVHFVAGHVNIALAGICYALFTTAATIIRQLIERYRTLWRILLPASGYLVALITVIWGIVLMRRGPAPENDLAGHVVLGIGLISACVSTVATSSTYFTFISRNAAKGPEAGAPDEVYSAATGRVLITIPFVCGLIEIILAIVLWTGSTTASWVAGHVVFGLGTVCLSLVSLVASIVRQVRNGFGDPERYRWSLMVIALGTINILLGLGVLLFADSSARIAPGCILIGLGLICYSILSKALLLALVWRRQAPLANRIPILPIITALTCLFFSSFLAEAADTDSAFFVAARVLVGLGAVCFTLFSIVSILEAGTST